MEIWFPKARSGFFRLSCEVFKIRIMISVRFMMEESGKCHNVQANELITVTNQARVETLRRSERLLMLKMKKTEGSPFGDSLLFEDNTISGVRVGGTYHALVVGYYKYRLKIEAAFKRACVIFKNDKAVVKIRPNPREPIYIPPIQPPELRPWFERDEREKQESWSIKTDDGHLQLKVKVQYVE
jgi:hypothetical protein